MTDSRGAWVQPRVRTLVVLSLLLVAGVAAIYAPVRHHEYLDYDDMAYLVWNPDLEPDSPIDALRVAWLHTSAANWMPVTILSHQLDRWLYGGWAGGALLTNVALHALASVLLLFALLRLCGRLGPSAFAAAVFAVHPLHVESVAWAIERKDVLSGVFFAALLWLYARYSEAPEVPSRYRAVLLCLALGLLSKPMLVTAPCVLLLLDAWPLRRLDRSALREKAPMFAMVAVVSWLTLRAQNQRDAFAFGMELPLWARLGNAVEAIGAYLLDSVWPVGLAAYYPHPGTELAWGAVGVSAALLIAISAGAVWLRRSQPWWCVGWFWFLGMLVPVSGLLQVGMQARADRYTYLPLIGLAWSVGLGADAWATSPQRRRALALLGLCAVMALGGVASKQVGFWSDSRTLYERMRSVHPQAAFPVLRLGMVEVIDGHFEQARPDLDRALELDRAQGARIFRQLGDLADHQVSRGLRAEASATLDFGIGLARDHGFAGEASALRLQRGMLGL